MIMVWQDRIKGIVKTVSDARKKRKSVREFPNQEIPNQKSF